MIQKLSLTILSLFLFSTVVIAEEAAITKSADESAQTAEGELSKLEQAVGKSSDDSAAVDAEAKVAADEASSKPWLPAAKEFDWVQLTSGEWLKYRLGRC